MASTVTRITDVIVPSIFLPYMWQKSTQLSRLVQSGILQNSPEFAEIVSGGGTTFNLPFWNEVNDEAQTLDDEDALETRKLTSQKDVAVRHALGNAWSTNDLAVALAGNDPMDAIATQLANWWNKQYQSRVLIPSLKGIFTTALSSTHVNNLAIEAGAAAADGNLISADAFIDTMAKLGDHWDKIEAIAMHSVPFFRLQKLGLIETVQLQDQNINIRRFQGREVIVDDTLPAVAGSTSGFKYTTYLFARNAVAYGKSSNPKVEEMEFDRDILAGDDVMAVRSHFLMHPRGVAFTGTPAGAVPTKAELEDGANWTKRWTDKNIPVLALITNG